MSYSVGQVAGFAGVTVRTLHHYDDIGLLVPGERSHAGHRRYNDADLDRLQQILFYRELGFPLEEVAALLDDPDADPHAHLRRQHELLSARIEKLQKMAAAVEHAMEARKMGIDLTPEEKFEVFGDHDPDQYEEEAENAGATPTPTASRSSARPPTPRRTGSGSSDEADELTRRFVALMDGGGAGGLRGGDGRSPRPTASRSRRNHYDCGHEMHTCLGEMYVTDERFTAAHRARQARSGRVHAGRDPRQRPAAHPLNVVARIASGPRPAVMVHGGGSRLSPGRGTVHAGYPRGTWAPTAAFIIWAANPARFPQLQEPHPRDHACARPEWLSPDYLIETFSLPGILLIVFAESGLFAFLPGDSLLFTAGLFVAEGNYISQPLWLVCTLIVMAAVIGDQVGYMIGKFLGPKLFSRPNSKLFKQENLEKAHEFMEKYGPKVDRPGPLRADRAHLRAHHRPAPAA